MAIIYMATNLINNKKYIGKTERTLEVRKKEHLKRTNEASYFHRSLKKYGADNFKWEIIEECDVSIVNEREKYWIDFYQTYIDKSKGYNETPGGEGYRLSEEIKQKISLANQNKIRTTEQRAHLSKVKKEANFHHSIETRKKMSVSRKGRKLNLTEAEHIRRQQKWSDERKNKLSLSLKNRTFSAQHKKHISESRKSKFILYTDKGEQFTTWEEILSFLKENHLTSSANIAVIRNNIKAVIDKENQQRYGRRWSYSKISDLDKIVDYSSSYIKRGKHISTSKRKVANELIIMKSDIITNYFNSREEAFNYCIENNIINNISYAHFSSKIGEASKKSVKYKKYYWNIKQKDVETREK